MQYIYQNPDWHKFTCLGEKVQNLLLEIKKEQVVLLGKMNSLGFDIQNNAQLQILTEKTITKS